MADYPDSIYSPRTKENRSGVVYDEAKKTVIFAEDVVKLDNEVVALETFLGLPAGQGLKYPRVKATENGFEYVSLNFANLALSNLVGVALNASLVPATDLVIDLGSSGPKYFLNAYIQKLYLNATATLDGATAGQINLAGNLNIGANKIKTTTLLLKEGTSNSLYVRLVDDSDYRDLTFRRLFAKDPYGEIGVPPTHYSGVALMIDGGTSYYTPLWIESNRYQSGMDFTVKNRANADVLNSAGFSLLLNTNLYTRYAMSFSASFSNITDNQRTSTAYISGAKAGSFITFLKFIGGRPIFPNPTVPATANATGEAGEISWDADYFYVCVATNTWKRVALLTW